MITLHDNLSSGNGYKVRLLLAMLGTPFRRIEYDIDRGETRTPDYLARINANGRIPVLELPDGRTLPESNAILWYLAEGTAFLPDDRWLRADVLRWMFFEQYSHEPNIATVRYWITHHVEMNEERRASLEPKRERGRAALAVMEEHLGRHPFLVGDQLTIADLSLYAYTHVAREGGFDLGPHEAMQAWLDRVASQPGHVPITHG